MEIIVVELLTAMGYGDGQVTEKTNDGGLDGVERIHPLIINKDDKYMYITFLAEQDGKGFA